MLYQSEADWYVALKACVWFVENSPFEVSAVFSLSPGGLQQALGGPQGRLNIWKLTQTMKGNSVLWETELELPRQKYCTNPAKRRRICNS